jgi:hypothetical protein
MGDREGRWKKGELAGVTFNRFEGVEAIFARRVESNGSGGECLPHESYYVSRSLVILMFASAFSDRRSMAVLDVS